LAYQGESPHKLLLVFGVLWVQNHPDRQARGEYADHAPQGAWAPVASPDEVEASVVQRLDHWSVACPAVRIKTTSGLPDGTSSTLPRTPDDLAGETKTCWIQSFPGMTNTASVTSLQIPYKAQKEYEQACQDVKNKKCLRRRSTCARPPKSTPIMPLDG